MNNELQVFITCTRGEFGYEAVALWGELRSVGYSESSQHRAIKSASRKLRRKIRHHERMH